MVLELIIPNGNMKLIVGEEGIMNYNVTRIDLPTQE